MKESIFERIGGENAIVAAVPLFYEKVLIDPKLAPFFERLPMEKQHMKMVSFMGRAFGGPSEYEGRDLRTAHKDLVKTAGLTDEHFDLVAQHLVSTLKELGIGEDLIDEVVEVIASTRSEVLDR